MTLDPRALGTLISAAMAAPPDVSELRTDAGDVVPIERDPEPGLALRLSAASLPDWEVLVTRVADAPPSRYPAGVPFISGATALVARTGERCAVSWLKAGDLAEFKELMAQAASLVGDPLLATATERLKPLIRRASEGDAEARGALRDEAALIRAAMSGDAKEKLRDVWNRLQPEAERAAALERVFRQVVEATEADGWEQVDASASVASRQFGVETRAFRRGSMERSVSLALTYGPVSMVMLRDQPAATGGAG